MYIDIFIYIGINKGINNIILNKFEIETGGHSNKGSKRLSYKYRGIRFLLSRFGLLISTNYESRFNLIKITVFIEFVYIYLYIIEYLFPFGPWFIYTYIYLSPYFSVIVEMDLLYSPK